MEDNVRSLESPFRLLRRSLGLTIVDVAAASGVSDIYWKLIERGGVRNPKKVFGALAELGVDTEQLAEEHARWCDVRARAARKKIATAMRG